MKGKYKLKKQGIIGTIVAASLVIGGVVTSQHFKQNEQELESETTTSSNIDFDDVTDISILEDLPVQTTNISKLEVTDNIVTSTISSSVQKPEISTISTSNQKIETTTVTGVKYNINYEDIISKYKEIMARLKLLTSKLSLWKISPIDPIELVEKFEWFVISSSETTTSNDEKPTTSKSTTNKPTTVTTSKSTTNKPTTVTTSENTTKEPITVTSSENTTKKPITVTLSENTTKKPITVTLSENTTKKPITVTSLDDTTKKPITVTPPEDTTKKPVTVTPPEDTTKKPVTVTSSEDTTKEPVTVTSSEDTTKEPEHIHKWKLKNISYKRNNNGTHEMITNEVCECGEINTYSTTESCDFTEWVTAEEQGEKRICIKCEHIQMRSHSFKDSTSYEYAGSLQHKEKTSHKCTTCDYVAPITEVLAPCKLGSAELSSNGSDVQKVCSDCRHMEVIHRHSITTERQASDITGKCYMNVTKCSDEACPLPPTEIKTYVDHVFEPYYYDEDDMLVYESCGKSEFCTETRTRPYSPTSNNEDTIENDDKPKVLTIKYN